MIDPIIDYLNALIAPLGFSTHGVTTLLERDGVTFPGVYYREGESLAINQETDHVYHRITARTQSREPDSSPVGGEDLLVKSFSMRCVASFTRGMVADTGDEEQDVAGNLETILNSQNLQTLAAQIGYISIAVTSENIETGREVWETELDGIEYDMSRGFCAVEYEVQIRAQESCFAAQACGEEVDIVQVIQDQYCGDSGEDSTAEDSEGTSLGSAPNGSPVVVGDVEIKSSGSAYSENVPIGQFPKTLADMVIDYPDGTTENLEIDPGATVASPPNFVLNIDGAATSYQFQLPPMDASFVVSSQNLTGAGSVSNIVINGAAAVASFVGQTLGPNQIVSFDITPSVTRIILATS